MVVASERKNVKYRRRDGGLGLREMATGESIGLNPSTTTSSQVTNPPPTPTPLRKACSYHPLISYTTKPSLRFHRCSEAIDGREEEIRKVSSQKKQMLLSSLMPV